MDTLFSFISQLSGVQRFSMLKACHPENVLEHTGMVAILCLVLGKRINNNVGAKLDLAVLLERAIVHDWDETVTGDVARPTKYHSQTLRNEMEHLEKIAIDRIAKKLSIDLWEHANAKLGREGVILKICDIAAMVHRLWEEVILYNNMHFTGPADNILALLKKTYMEIPTEYFGHQQGIIIDKFVNDLERILMSIRQRGIVLRELHNAH